MMNCLTTDCGVLITFPTEMGNYRYLKPIGKGSSSVVILVEKKNSQDLYSAKLLKRDKIINKNFERELRFLQQKVKHPNIVSVYDILYFEETIAVIMEYCPCGDLVSELSKQGHFDLSTLRQYCYQLISAVSYLHRFGWAHRDIKSDNILISKSGVIKLTDFGHCGEIIESDPMMSTLCGTYFYTPPEVIEEKPYDGKKCDIWSLGVVMFCMASGQLPWQQGSETAMRERMLEGKIMDLPIINEDCMRLIKMCIVVDPNKRATANELLDDNWFTPISLLRNHNRNKSNVLSKPLLIQKKPKVLIGRKTHLSKHAASLYHLTFS
ncbi:hypothetical protein M9Y10_022352 [Tritrichomonas musculus]|uniref:Protein kinase domain-containing protein n=1 Tax=Tritrichomonas musculus TaxID=1915356 RepID=A0ABR2KS90_9EUKA